LDVSGTMTCRGDFQIDDQLMFADTTLGRIGINDYTPQYTLDVCGSAQFRNTNNQMSLQNVFRIRNLQQSVLGDPNYVRLANTNTSILFKAQTTDGNYSNTSTPVVLYTFDTHVHMIQIQYDVDINNYSFAGTIINRIFIVDKDGVYIPNTEFIWNQTPNGSLPTFSLSSPAIASLTSQRFPIRVQYTYNATFPDLVEQYMINKMEVNVQYRSSALQVIGNMNVLQGTVSIGKTVSLNGSPPTVDISGSLSTTRDIRVATTDFVIDTTTHNIGIGKEPALTAVVDISSVNTGNIVRIMNPGLAAGENVGLTLGRGNTTSNQFQMIFDYTQLDSSLNRLLLGTPDVSNILCIEANRNVGIGLVDRRPNCRLSLGNHSHTRSLALHENNNGDRFFGFGAQYSALGDVSNTLHIYARSDDTLTRPYGQLMVHESGNVGLSTNTRPIDKRLVVGNISNSIGSFIEFDNRASMNMATPSIYKGYAIGSTVNEYGTDRNGQLAFVYTGSALEGEQDRILMSINSSGYLGLGINPSTYIIDISQNAPARMAVSSLNVVATGASVNTLFVDATNSSVAINKNTATETLDVAGTARISSYLNVVGDLTVDTQSLYVNSTTNRVGISTLTPIHTLDVNGSVQIRSNQGTAVLTGDASSNGLFIKNANSSGGAIIQLQNNTSTDNVVLAMGASANSSNLYSGLSYSSAAILHSTQNWSIGTSGEKIVRFYTNNLERMRIDACGNIAIGTLDSTSNRGKVIIEGAQSFPNLGTSATSYNYGGSNTTINNISTRPVSLYCSNNIVCSSIIVFSDERIKKNIVPLNTDDSLVKVVALNPVSFNYIDRSKSAGDELQHGFLAQEVKKVIPEAVSTTRDFIPDVFCMVQITNGVAEPLTNSYVFPASCKSATVVIAYNDLNTSLPLLIVDVPSNRQLRIVQVNCQEVPDGIYFIYGSQVDNYHILDNNVLMTHCIGAVKSIAEIQKKQQKEIDELRAIVSQLTAKIGA
jgi:hypothetical protein